MLHELLLALSGHPSPLLQSPTDQPSDNVIHEHLSPAEDVLLRRLAQNIGEKHKTIRDNVTTIASVHASTVCRALATSIKWTFLEEFQETILAVERGILEEDPSYVGAYKIVPLSGIVGAFDGWSRKLQWLLSLVTYIQEGATLGKDDDNKASCTGAQAIKWLRDSANTGYPDIEELSHQLIGVAETAWLRLLCAWVLYGKLPRLGLTDFFVRRKPNSDNQGSADDYEIDYDLAPCFVTPSTANSILFIGKSLNHIRNRALEFSQGAWSAQSPELALLPNHLEQLSSLKPPISISSFSTAISAIRLSLSQHVQHKLLPISRVLEILRVLRDFFLLERGEFAVALITAADERLASRQSKFTEKVGVKDSNALKSALIREGEVSAVLARTWAAMASLQGPDDEEIDEDLELARDLISLSLKATGSNSIGNEGSIKIAFDDLLLPSPTTLSLQIQSPLDLFLTLSEVNTYSHIHSYLLALRRAHLRLSKTFLLSTLRRDHPSPKSPIHNNSETQLESLERMRQRAHSRSKSLRPIWVTISSAAFMLSELGEYIQGEVIQSSWKSFRTWLDPSTSEASTQPGTNSSPEVSTPLENLRISSSTSAKFHDPESLTQAHRTYLSSLVHALFLDDACFTTELRAFMSAVDHLSAMMHRLETIYRNLDLEASIGVVDTFTDYAAEEKDVVRELAIAKGTVAEGVSKLVEALKEIDLKRIGGEGRVVGFREEGEDVFVPERGIGVDRLLLRLEGGR